MELIFSDDAKTELENLNQDMKNIFLLHLEKIHARPPRKTYETWNSLPRRECNPTGRNNLRYAGRSNIYPALLHKP